jgi:hypothetical protein
MLVACFQKAHAKQKREDTRDARHAVPALDSARREPSPIVCSVLDMHRIMAALLPTVGVCRRREQRGDDA